MADDLGLGKYTTEDGVTYTFPSGTAPEVNSVLFAEDSAGGKTLRRVVSATTSGSGEVTVTTGDASLTDVIDRGSIYSSVKLFDVQQAVSRLDNTSDKIASGSHRTRGDGSQYSRIEWKDGLLAAEQTDYAYNEQDLTVEPQGNKRTVRNAKIAGDSVFDVIMTFEPDVISWAEWGGEGFIKKLESAQVSAKGTLSLEAIAKLELSAGAEWENRFKVWDAHSEGWRLMGPSGIWVWQKITLTVEAVVSASASAEINAEASAKISETIEVGAKYDGTKWTPYITSGEEASLSASLTVVGGAEAEIRLIPSIEVGFYKISSAKLSVEPFLGTGIAFKETTDNAHFIAANPEHILQLTSFGAEMGLESKLSVTLGALGILWEVVPETCVLGTGSCLYQFDSLKFFSIPELSLRQTGMSEDEKEIYLELQVQDGIKNPFNPDSVIWEVFPAHLSDINPTDAEIIPKSCTGGEGNTTCEATLIRGQEEEYTVFASGYGVIGETGRQFKELPVNGDMILEGFWRSDDGLIIEIVSNSGLFTDELGSWWSNVSQQLNIGSTCLRNITHTGDENSRTWECQALAAAYDEDDPGTYLYTIWRQDGKITMDGDDSFILTSEDDSRTFNRVKQKRIVITGRVSPEKQTLVIIPS